jgi:hypothetical protein
METDSLPYQAFQECPHVPTRRAQGDAAPPSGARGFRATFQVRLRGSGLAPLQRELQAITDAAWAAYDDSRKAPITRKAGTGFADPDYEIAIDWLTARAAIDDARVVMMTPQDLRASSSSMARPAPSTPVPAKCRSRGAWSRSRTRSSRRARVSKWTF